MHDPSKTGGHIPLAHWYEWKAAKTITKKTMPRYNGFTLIRLIGAAVVTYVLFPSFGYQSILFFLGLVLLFIA